MRIAILTNEYPPHIYGGAGVHVEYLTRELSRELRTATTPSKSSASATSSFARGTSTFQRCQPDRNSTLPGPQTRQIPGHNAPQPGDGGACSRMWTWSTATPGTLTSPAVWSNNSPGRRLVLTTHSLEPHRPWKVEQLGSAYNASSWVERTAYENADGVIAVSASMRDDVHDLYRVPRETRSASSTTGSTSTSIGPRPNPSVLARYGIDPGPAIRPLRGPDHPPEGNHPPGRGDSSRFDRGSRLSLCAGAPDTPEIGREMAERVERARLQTENPIIWIPEIVPKDRDHRALHPRQPVRLPVGL